MRLSLRARLTIWYTLALLTVLCLFAVAVLWQQSRIGLRRVDRELQAFGVTLANVMRDEVKEVGDPRAAAKETLATVAPPGLAIAILNEHGTPLAASWGGLTLQPPLPSGEGVRVWTDRSAARPWRVHAELTQFETARVNLVVGTPLDDVYREQREAQEAMLVGIPIALLLAGAGGLWLASIGLRPITDMAGRATQIPLNGMEDLGESDRADELGQLARSFNGLVARLRAALGTQRRFMADASHELRTPVSVIRSAADVTLSRRQRDETEYRDALGIVGDEARRLGTLVEDMLVLARADAGGYPLRPVDLYLDEILSGCRRTLDVVAAERGVALNVKSLPELPFRGDEDLLRRMLLNVLQNAVQHTPPGRSVDIEAESKEGMLNVRVCDHGAGIAADDRERIFDRFVQLDPARRGNGTGLGLPIARWIAEAHGGRLALEASGPDGSRFLITLPTETAESSAKPLAEAVQHESRAFRPAS
jgi:heavy metal sensor kinase